MKIIIAISGCILTVILMLIFGKKEDKRKIEALKKEAWSETHELSHNNATCQVAWKKGVPHTEEEWEWTLYCTECGHDLIYTHINEQGLIYGGIVHNSEYDCNPTPEGKKRYDEMVAKKFVHATIPNPKYKVIAMQRELERKRSAEKNYQSVLRVEMALAQNKLEAWRRMPKCPTCHSTNIGPIGIGTRMISVDFLGLASPTIGKSYQCRSCGYMW